MNKNFHKYPPPTANRGGRGNTTTPHTKISPKTTFINFMQVFQSGMSMSVEQKATMGEVRLMIRVIDSYNKIGQKPTLSNFKQK